MVLDTPTLFGETTKSGGDEFFVSEAEQALTPRLVVKLANESVTNSTTMQDDDELFMSVSADSVYYFKVSLQASSAELTRDLDYTFTGPTNSTGRFWVTITASQLATDKWVLDFGDETGHGDTTTQIRTFEGEGFIRTGNTAGNLQLQWAMGYAGAGDSTVVLAGSFLEVIKQ